MDLWQSLVLGIVQGFTEFLPISSTAHLILVPGVMRWKDPGLAFDVALHVGTLFAVAWYFWRDFVELGHAWYRSLRNPRLREDPQQRMAWFVLVACIPGGIAGVLLDKQASHAFRDPLLIGVAMIGFAVILALSEFMGRRVCDEKGMTWRHALTVGFAQALAIIPGASRSGVTITAGLFAGMTREAAARFSFLVGTPIIVAAVLYKLKDLLGVSGDMWLAIAVGIASSAVTGYLSIKFLISYLRHRTTGIFIGYRVVVGAVIIGLAMSNQLPRPGSLAGGSAVVSSAPGAPGHVAARSDPGAITATGQVATK